jgi:uncharacterized surface protein with fasciclin (FAS1) repeats
MTAMMPSNESKDYQFMYNLPDLRGECIPVTERPTSILGFLNKHTDFSKFTRILNIANMHTMFDMIQFDKTVFVPINAGISDEFMETIDQHKAKALINFCMMKRVVNKTIIAGTPASYFITDYKPCSKLLVTNNNGVSILNEQATILDYDINLDNGVIHIIDNILVPYTII